MSIATRKAALMARVAKYGGPLNEPAVLAQFLAQVMHESGGLRYVREIWGPTKAQRGYEGRKDLGNTQAGDGKRFMGRDVIQITGRANYRALSKWAGFDFEAKPEALEREEWLGIGAIWYFLAARKDLIKYCRDGNIEMVTRRVNGGLNGYADRLKRYDEAALEILGVADVRTFQRQAGLVVDGISGPKTRAALHKAMSQVKETPVSVTRPEPHVNAEAPNSPAQAQSVPKPSQGKEVGKAIAGGAAGALAVLAAYAVGLWQRFTEFADWITFWR